MEGRDCGVMREGREGGREGKGGREGRERGEGGRGGGREGEEGGGREGGRGGEGRGGRERGRKRTNEQLSVRGEPLAGWGWNEPGVVQGEKHTTCKVEASHAEPLKYTVITWEEKQTLSRLVMAWMRNKPCGDECHCSECRWERKQSSVQVYGACKAELQKCASW